MGYLDFLLYLLSMHGIIDPYFFFRISDEDLIDKKNSSDKNISLTLYYFFQLHMKLCISENVLLMRKDIDVND